MLLTELAGAVPVDVMPGAGDPANYTLPQQPLHACLFPGAAGYSSLHRATNPHDFSVDGVAFLGTSGQSVDDVARCALLRGGGGGGWVKDVEGQGQPACPARALALSRSLPCCLSNTTTTAATATLQVQRH